MFPRPLSRLLVVGGAVLLALSTGTQAQTAAPADRAQAARDLLASPASRFITPMGLRALAAMAGMNPVAGADSATADAATADEAAAQAAGRATLAPEAPVAPAGLENVRVNDPRQDEHQQAQTTQSETTI